MAEPAAFLKLHPHIQEELYRMRWKKLRPFQVEAIDAILGDKGHIVISAMTAGGKTEAAFLPILSDIIEDSSSSVRALYIGPLKALINDQFRRLEELCERSEIPVFKWHGDVGQSPKQKFLKSPGGVLLITPESVESLFINHPDKLNILFSHLSYIVLDEVHVFLDTERGAHLRSLVSRLMQRIDHPIRIVGLSATLGDMESTKLWIDCRNPAGVRLIKSEETKTICFLIKGYKRAVTGEETGAITASKNDEMEEATEDDFRLARDLIKQFSHKTALIFINNKQDIEKYTDLVNRILEKDGMPNPFYIHHGSLSKEIREKAEAMLRSSRPTAAFCSGTLELGIDVGNVREIGQIGAPWSVSSLKQRLGRSGRHEGEASVLSLYVLEDEVNERTNPIDRLYPQLLRSIAMTELMLERWCEPPELERWHLSTLIQQVMSVIAEAGGATALTLHERLIARGAFHNIDQAIFLRTLRSMRAKDLIEQTSEGVIILGLAGERIVRSLDFYAAFVTVKEFRVVHHGHLVGTVGGFPSTGADNYLILAGRRWKIIEIDAEKMEILVEKSPGGRVPKYGGDVFLDLHPRIHEKMREMLIDTRMPVYLDSVAKDMLNEARKFARESGVLLSPFFRDGDDLFWFTWCGSKVNRTLRALGMHGGLIVYDEDIALHFNKVSETEIQTRYMAFLCQPPDILELAKGFPIKAMEKYDRFLDEDLLTESYAHDYLDLNGAMEVIKRLQTSDPLTQ